MCVGYLKILPVKNVHMVLIELDKLTEFRKEQQDYEYGGKKSEFVACMHIC